MFGCKHCGYKYEYTGNECPVCGSKPIIDKNDIEFANEELKAALREKNFAKIHIYRKLLADSGDVESCREFAKLLERGEYKLRDIDTAMNYYYIAAENNDAYSAYRYSRLVRRISENAGDFWLRFSAILGSIDAYPETAELFSSLENEEAASYYYSLAAACDDTDSIVTMSKRWFTGTGVPKNDSYAKWYLDKLAIPPISAIKLAYKLRSAKASEPPKLSFPDYLAYIRNLISEANALKFNTAEFYLVSYLSHSGDINAETKLGIMLAEGKGCKQNAERAKECLNSAIAAGNSAAAIYMGESLIIGNYFEKNPDEAIKYFEIAATLGYTNAYEKLGDLYHDGIIAEKNIPKALEFYELASHGGSLSAREKCNKIKDVREKYYLDAYKIINIKKATDKNESFEAFRSAAIASAMGDDRAMILLAKCYLGGLGTEIDRTRAFFWFKSAANTGNSDAIFYSGICYSRGIGTAFSYKNAITALKYAQNAGIKGAAEELDKLYRRRMKKMIRSLYSSAMTLIYKKDYNGAVDLLLSFDSLSYPKAIYTLGCLYEFGRGVPRSDRTKANYYYEKAFSGSRDFEPFKDPLSKYKLKILKMIR